MKNYERPEVKKVPIVIETSLATTIDPGQGSLSDNIISDIWDD